MTKMPACSSLGEVRLQPPLPVPADDSAAPSMASLAGCVAPMVGLGVGVWDVTGVDERVPVAVAVGAIVAACCGPARMTTCPSMPVAGSEFPCASLTTTPVTRREKVPTG